ncbi:hypothetical protein RI129_009315 [Pyrocoelia pectoralis]|uniref:Enoyl reductase (ER) domain-containing protein n=1 Tax=Pyrocoelia pectoralis TaxID=417401 RepID=A0AAN7V5U2_9COLE
MEFSEKAVVLQAFGSYNCLKVDKFPLPPLDGNVEVKVECCGLNFVDIYTRQGFMQHYKLPMVLGTECVGVVSAIGCTDRNFKVDQRVVCFDYEGGLFRDTLRISPKKCYPLPDDITNEQGAAIFVNYLTAYFALFELGSLKSNSTVLIMSCGGGVGCAATQLAKTVQNVTVVGVASEGKEEAIRANGVDHVVNYGNWRNEISEKYPNGFDVIIDNQGGDTFNFLQTKINQLGTIILIGANTSIQDDNKLSTFNLLKLWWKTKYVNPKNLIYGNKSVAGLHLGVLTEKEPDKVLAALELMYKLLREGKIVPKIYHKCPIEDIVTASKLLAERKNVGKVLLTVK